MKVSVIIPTYKRAKYLEKSLIAILNQHRLPDEIILIRNQDDSDTAVLVDTIRKSHPNARLIKDIINPKVDIVFNENQGLRVSQGDIICFIDDDAIAPENWITLITGHYERDASIGGVGGPVIPYINEKPVIEYTNEFAKITWCGRRITNSTKIPYQLVEVDLLRGANMSFRRVLIEEFDERLLPYWRRFEDDICLSLKAGGYKIICDPLIKVFHYEAPVQNALSRDDTPERIIGVHHNSVYVKLKHFKGMRKACALAVEFLWGDDTAPGFFPFCIQAIKYAKIHKLALLVYAMIGKIRGIRTYFIWKHQKR